MRSIAAKTIITTALVLGISHSAFAASEEVLVGGPLVAGSTSDFDCLIVNVSDENVTVTIEMLSDATVIVSKTESLAPGVETVLFRAGKNDTRYCKFTVSAKASAVRASAAVLDPVMGHVAAVPAR